MVLIEIAGIIAGVLVLISFAFKNLLIIRIINAVGCAVFVAYGSVIGAWSIVGLNGALFCLQIYYIVVFFVKKKKAGNKQVVEEIKQ